MFVVWTTIDVGEVRGMHSNGAAKSDKVMIPEEVEGTNGSISDGAEHYSFQWYLDLKHRLGDVAARTGALADELDLGEGTRTNVGRMHGLLMSDAFRLVVVGGFSRGKSTLINALLGQDVLPAKLAPCTAIINTIRYAEEPEVALYRLDAPEDPIRIAPDELNHYVTIVRTGFKQRDDGAEIVSPYERAEIGYPLPLLQQGVEIVDTPGLEEDAARERITLSYLNKADAAIMVLSCNMLFNSTEERFVDQELKQRGYQHIFYVANYADLVTDEQDRRDLERRIDEKLPGETKIYFLSARKALYGKLDDDEGALDESGFPAFERDLETFLVRERGRAKLQAVTAPLRIVIDDMEQWIERHLHVLERWGEEDLLRLEEEARTVKQSIEERKNRLLLHISEAGRSMVDRAISLLVLKCDEVARELPEVASQLEIPDGFFDLLQRNKYKEQVARGLHRYVQDALKSWTHDELNPAVGKEFERAYGVIERELEGIVADVDRLRELITPDVEQATPQGEDVFERVLSAAGALLFGDVVGAITGGVFGMRGMFMQIAGSAVAGALLWTIGLLNPVTAVLATLAVATGVVSLERGRVTQKMRAEVVERFQEHVRDVPRNFEKEIRGHIMGELNRFTQAVMNGIANMTEDAERHLVKGREQILADRKAALALHRQHRETARGLQQDLVEFEREAGIG